MTTKNAKVWDTSEAVIDGLMKIDSLTHVGGPAIPLALAAMRAIIHELRDGAANNLDPVVVKANIQAHYDAVHSNDDAARAELRRRFPGMGS